ncbi:MAG TPA: TonB-dependent receptor [Vicinamibacterales bacterium]
MTLIDAVSADVISDRVDTGGLAAGTAARMGGHASSWTQTRFLLDGVDITDGDGSGTPLLVPGVLEWERVDVMTGAMPIDVNATGLAISLTARRPTTEWTRRIEGFGAPPAFVSDPFLKTAPTISRLNSYANGSFLASGPILPDRLGIVVAGSWIASSRFDRTDPTKLDSSRGSLFTHLVFTPGPRDELRVIGWGEHTASPYENRTELAQPTAGETDNAVHGQATWDRRMGGDRLMSGFASYSIRQRAFDLRPVSSVVIDDVIDPPISGLLYPGPGTDTAWTVGATLKPLAASASGIAALQIGAQVSGASADMQPAFTSATIGEGVNGLPARVWSLSSSGMPSHWSDTTVAIYASDHIAVLPKLTADLGLRFEAVNGSAQGSAGSVSWHDFLPRAALRWSMLDWSHIAFFANYSRTAYNLPLTALAWGDPNAASGFVSRWNATTAAPPLPGQIGAIVQRVGPGTGITGITSIDPALARPYMDEIVLGFDGRPNSATLVRLSAMARRERQLLGVVDTGVPESSYTLSHVADPGVDLAGTQDDQFLPIFNRPPATFGRDTYVLTNPADNEATLVGVDLSIQSHTDRLFYVFGATASRSEGLAGNRGFLATENDEGVLGDVFIDPNSRTFAQGRTFTERGYTIKTAGTYHFDHDIRLGITARYQDGQHFARLVLAPDLTQGPELIRAFRNGKTRFTYTMTVDARLQKGFTVNGYRLTGILDAYNLFNQHTEIEEYPLTGPLSRTTTAIQPPRAIHAGIRLTF